MREITDMDRVKRVALTFLEMDLEINKDLPFLVLHPFFDSIAVNVRTPEGYKLVDISQDKKYLEMAKADIRKEIMKSTTPEYIYLMMRNADKRTFFFYTKDCYNKKDFSECFRSIWLQGESPSIDINVPLEELREMFLEADKDILMDEEDKKFYDNLEDTLTIYRGVQEKEYKAGLSWTTNPEIAKYFATRYKEHGYILETTISKKDIIAAFDSSEDEVIVDYLKIKDVNIQEI